MRVFIFILLTVCFETFAQPGSRFLWTVTPGGTATERPYSMAADGIGHTYTTGTFRGTSTIGSSTLQSQSNNAFLAKYDSAGQAVWARQSSGTNVIFSNSVTLDSAGSIYIFGTFLDSTFFGTDTLVSSGGNDLFVAKYDTSGNLLWATAYGGSFQDGAVSITADLSGGIYIAGYFSQSIQLGGFILQGNGNPNDIFLAKLDTTGQVLWALCEGGSSADQPAQISFGSDGHVYMAGYYQQSTVFGNDTFSTGTGTGILLARFDTSGLMSWVRSIGAASSTSPASLITDGLDGIYLTGTFFDSCYFASDTLRSFGGNDIFLCKYDTLGDYRWSRHAGGPFSSESSNAVVVDTSGLVYIAGSFFSQCVFGTDTLSGGSIYIAKYDSAGQHVQSFSARGSSFVGMTTDPMSGVYAAGTFVSYGVYGADTFSVASNSSKLAISRLADCATVPDVEICLVTVDSLGKDVQLVFDKNIPPGFVDSFVVYRAIPGDWFRRVGALDFSALSVFTDTSAAVDSVTYDYKIAVKDECGVIGNRSVSHGTIRLRYLGSGDFEWTPYRIDTSSSAVAAYRIYRDDTGNGNFLLIQTVSGSTTVFYDPDYLNYPDARYRVDVSWLSALVCTPTRSFTTSMSNIEDLTLLTGVNDPVMMSEVLLYPNPTSGFIRVDYSRLKGLKECRLEIIDLHGRIFGIHTSETGTVDLDMTGFTKGMYLAKIIFPSTNGMLVRRFVVE